MFEGQSRHVWQAADEHHRLELRNCFYKTICFCRKWSWNYCKPVLLFLWGTLTPFNEHLKKMQTFMIHKQIYYTLHGRYYLKKHKRCLTTIMSSCSCRLRMANSTSATAPSLSSKVVLPSFTTFSTGKSFAVAHRS